MKVQITEIIIKDRPTQPECIPGRGWTGTWSEIERTYNSRPRVYCYPAKETVIENFAEGRWNRPIKALKEQIIPEIIERLRADNKIKEITPKARWSQKAGCSCPCSPGFILDNGHGYDVFVTYSVVAD